MKVQNEKGIALVLSLFLMAAMSVIGASLMFLSQTETYSSMNYRLMSQARYGAESGVQKAANYLLYSYTAPATAGADPIGNYNTNVSPVTCASGCTVGQPIVLSASAAQASNYPVPGVQAAFLAAVGGTLPAGTTTVSYAPYATLMSMQQIDVYGGGVQTIQTWRITSDGSITVGRTAQVQVTAVLETPKFPALMYGAFGTAGTCGALQFGGSTQTNSYDSTAALGADGTPVTSNSGGNVGTNGNMTESGSADIYGTLSSPRVGVGSCSDGNVDALSTSGGATVNGHKPPETGDIVHLSQAVSLPVPTTPTGVPTNAYNGNNVTLLNGASVGNVTVTTGTLTLGAVGTTSTINMNSLIMTGNSTLKILGTVILNIVGSGQTTPFDTTGGSISNLSATYNPSTFQILYAGTQAINLTGDSKAIGMLYAPQAAVTITGNNDFYGSVVAATIHTTGSSQIHYDRHLSSAFYTVGSPMLNSFSWKKY